MGNGKMYNVPYSGGEIDTTTVTSKDRKNAMLEYCRNCWAQAKACLSPSVKDEDAQPPKDSPPGG